MDWATFDSDSKWLMLRKTHEKKNACVAPAVQQRKVMKKERSLFEKYILSRSKQFSGLET